MIRFRSGGWVRYASDLPPLPAALVVEELDVRGAGKALQPVDIHRVGKTM